ncbi:MAG: holo-ACP synthase [Synergistaceae bacterium]|nr:holo-ACP synthase [Synergistaceae bacterium]
MIAGIGVDLCRVSRIQKALESEHFRTRIFTPEETAYCESKGRQKFYSYAAGFAAREAFVKAAGVSLDTVMFSGNFGLVRDEDGAPAVRLSGKLAELFPAEDSRIFVSLTHDGEYACAIVVIEKF